MAGDAKFKIRNDLVGLHWDTIPTVNEILTEGTTAEMRNTLRSMGERMKSMPIEDTDVSVNVNADDGCESPGHQVNAINGNAIAVGGSLPVDNGTVTLWYDGTLGFRPAPYYYGAASFTYTVSSASGNAFTTVSVRYAALMLPAEFKWLGEALIAIANGADANKAMGLKCRNQYGPRQLRGKHFLVKDLRRQGMKKEDALSIVARLTYDSKGKPSLRSDPVCKAGDTLKRLLSRRLKK